jgi:hypothetical protein
MTSWTSEQAARAFGPISWAASPRVSARQRQGISGVSIQSFEKRMTTLQIRDLGNEDRKPQRSQDFKMMIDIESKLSFPLVITGDQDVIYLNRPACWHRGAILSYLM